MVDGVTFVECLECGRLFQTGDFMEVFCSGTCGDAWDARVEEFYNSKYKEGDENPDVT